MPAPVAEKLAELRRLTNRIIEKDNRKAMTEARKRRIHKAHNGLCMYCGEPVDLKGPRVIYDHEIALELGGSDDDSNIGPIHASPCDKIKTAADHTKIAKVRRLEARDNGTRRARKDIPNRPLSHPTLKRRMNGEVTRR